MGVFFSSLFLSTEAAILHLCITFLSMGQTDKRRQGEDAYTSLWKSRLGTGDTKGAENPNSSSVFLFLFTKEIH